MFTKQLSITLIVLFVVLFFTQTKAQFASNQGIILNEYSASNAGAPLDSYGAASDWVELTTTQSSNVSLAGYYLSNDRYNLYKWKFPSTFTMAPGAYKAVWLTGKNIVTTGGEVHASFDLQQCKNQWLILTAPGGVVRDSIFVRKTQLGHSWERMYNSVLGINGWRLYNGNTFLMNNPPLSFTFKDYLPTPQFECNAGIYTPGNFCNPLSEVRIKINGHIADTVADCFNIHYTVNGDFPSINDPIFDSVANSPLQLVNTMMVRAVAYPKNGYATTTLTCLPDIYLPSFCQTNTFFYDQEYTQFQQEFGIVSIAIHSTEATWFAGGGSAPTSPTVHVEYFDKNQITEGYAKMFRPQQETWKTAQKGIYLTMDDKMGFGCDFTSSSPYPIFNVDGLGKSGRTVFPTLHLKAGDYESNSMLTPAPPSGLVEGTGIRDVFYQSLAIKNNLHVNPLHIKPVVAFINGKYQGVYDLREVFDQHYEAYYNNQAKDSVDLNINYSNTESNPPNGDGSSHPSFTPLSTFSTQVYGTVNNYPMNSLTYYNQVMSKLDKESFIDYFVLGTYAINNDFWAYNVAFGRGNQVGKPGTKWHYYMWNMPTIFNFTIAGNSGGIPTTYNNYFAHPCDNMYPTGNTPTIAITPNAFNGHGNMMKKLFQTSVGNASFQLDYKNRYQDLLNGPLRCDNILKHFDYINNLYTKEMHYHEDPGSSPTPGLYAGVIGTWDTNMVHLRRIIAYRCDWIINGLKTCYPAQGPYQITVDVEPAGAGVVKLNSTVLPYYKWTGNYFQTTLSFKAIPTNTLYTFHHWEFKIHQPLNNAPLSLDSVAISFVQSAGQSNEEVIAVFTDKSADITQNGDNANMPSAFSPNNDNVNDIYKPLGSAAFATEYDFRIYNRWGQEVFRTTDPATGWDGIYNGQQAQTGVYAWVINYKNVYGESKLAKGNVTLVR